LTHWNCRPILAGPDTDMLRLHTSHRLEALVQRLAEVVQTPLRSAMQPELIIVQSQGMARWLKLELANQQGICANCSFPFPKAFCAEVLAANATGVRPSSGAAGFAIPRAAESPATAQVANIAAPEDGRTPAVGLDREVMLWEIMRLLPTMLEQPEFAPLKRYLSDSADIRKRFQLASQIANLFDQYLVFRPELVLGWEEGHLSSADPAGNSDELWQAALWRQLRQEDSEPHLAALLKQFHHQSSQPQFTPQAVPERLSIFGISALPPSYLQLFAALGQRVDLHLFLLQPSKEYWGAIVSAREAGKLLMAMRQGDAAAEQSHLESGNRLLASMGKLGRDFLNLVLEMHWDEESIFPDPQESNLLQHIQADIFHLRDRGRDGTPKLPVNAADPSLHAHSCHSPLREVEVLYDHLLEWFQRDPALSPRDVLVMTPDIEAYAPFIEAVFDSPEESSKRIPFSVADRGLSSSSQVVQAFLSLLSLPTTRLEATNVLRILETEPVRAKFGLAEPDLDIIRDWVRRTNIRWGQDANQRKGLGLPALAENTWQQGMDRLFAGYAMAGNGEEMFGEVLPFDDVEGSRVQVLGHLAEYLKRLFDLAAQLRQRLAVAQWEEVLLHALETFFQPEDAQLPELLLVRTALRNLAAQATEAGYTEPVELAAISESLNHTLGEDRFGSGFITGGVTFCALKPMRSIPFKVICLIGMNDGAFPRADRHLSFDLMAQQPRLGDRSLRDDDRYLFLETLLSARERLHISYVGQSIRDNSEVPPSVLVSELLDYVAQGYELPSGDVVKDHVLVRHRLQAFSPAYFTSKDARLFSYSAENCRASRFGQADRAEPTPFLEVPLSEPEADYRTVDVAALANFFCNPARSLVTRRLGLRFDEKQEALEEGEPFEVGALDGYSIREELVDLALNHTSPADAMRLMKASGRLPLGEAGDVSFRALHNDVQAFLEKLRPHLGAGYIVPIQVDYALGEFRLMGEIRRLTVQGSLHYRCTKIKAKDLLRLWVQHLVLNADPARGAASSAVLVGSDTVLAAKPTTRAPELLARLLELYWKGLTLPLKFFPKTSQAYAEATLGEKPGKPGKDPITVARPTWEGNEHTQQPAECGDPYFDLCFRNQDPLDEEFAQTSLAVFGPLLNELKEVEQ
jgi:exodeoxyribonuclease V gamma subunit